ncbi:unnamed protein product [Cyprideis torosa]|uniref:Uncharacterized protein n=1 Tax=Cyprideis torosa TaxID=163714 RepID=A0A7R8WE87_9CRUS|nr:unnamed protein product [Cyprideis torosa]CAG0892583.1 unnamed protein product [Cyprideis torosa]
MGNTKSAVEEEYDMDELLELTYLTRKQIIILYDRFQRILREHQRPPHQPIPVELIAKEFESLQVNPFTDRLLEIFSTETSTDGVTDFIFEDLLDMASVLSPRATEAAKAAYAFKVYDFDGDNQLGREDLTELITRLTLEDISLHKLRKMTKGVSVIGESQLPLPQPNTTKERLRRLSQFRGSVIPNLVPKSRLSDDEIEDIVNKILEDCDLDKDGYISLQEFRHTLTKAPEFRESFSIRLWDD